MPVPTARPATKDDAEPLAAALTAAFLDDPITEWIFARERTRRRDLGRFYDAYLRRVSFRGHHDVYTTDDRAGAALWAAPKRWRLGSIEQLRLLPAFRFHVLRRSPSLLRGFQMLEKKHPRDEHWYLAVLGTEPARQHQGVGGALMAPVLARCDEEGLPAYLESSKETNVPFYRHHGFEVTEVVELPGGPAVWLMWREPRPGDGRG